MTIRIKETWVRPLRTGQAKDRPPFVLQAAFEMDSGATDRVQHCVSDQEITPKHWMELGLIIAQRPDAPRVEHLAPDDQGATKLEDLL